MLVELEHRYTQRGVEKLTETQTLIYRAAGGTTSLPDGDHAPEVPAGGWVEPRRIGTVALFRFSAVTFNGHRIHYDAPYAREIEGYPALVVHGPLTAIMLAESARRTVGRDANTFSFRAEAPLFADIPFTIVGTPTDDGATMTVIRNDATRTMTASLTFPTYE